MWHTGRVIHIRAGDRCLPLLSHDSNDPHDPCDWEVRNHPTVTVSYCRQHCTLSSCRPVLTAVCICRNIVSTVNLSCPLDLKFIALQARNAEYNPKVLQSTSCSCWHMLTGPLSHSWSTCTSCYWQGHSSAQSCIPQYLTVSTEVISAEFSF